MDWLLGGCCEAGGQLVWTTPGIYVALAAVAVVLVLALSALPRPKGRAGELLLLTLAVIPLVFALAGPVWVQEGEHREQGRFVVLIDGSRSMNVREGDLPRSAAVNDLLTMFPGADLYTFGAEVQPGPPTAYDGAESDLGGALTAISQRYAGEKLEGLAVITDGLDRGGLRRQLLLDPTTPLPRLNGPLTLYQVGTNTDRVDAAVAGVQGGAFAFLRSPFTLTADIVVRGTGQRSIPVTLTRDGQPAGSQTVSLDAEGKGVAKFEIMPDNVGRYIYEMTVPVIPGDAVPSNNIGTIAVRVVRDRLRVLQVCGAPSWDQKFLRLFLKEDPGVDLVSFFILRTDRDFGAGYGPDELSLIQFPYEQLFTTELWTFDLVIFQNFNYEPYFERDGEALLQNMADYVKKGGAFAMIGGDRSFDLGKYADTPLAPVLPVRLGVTGDPVDPLPFTPALTEAGQRHPITQMVADPAENQRIWQQLSQLDGLNLTQGVAEGAALLLAHPERKTADGQPAPVLAVGEYGAGRSMALTVDASWRWFLAEAGEGRGNQTYLRFYKNAMRWLIGDPEDRPVVIEVGQENYQPGEEVRVIVRARDVGFAAVPSANVELSLQGPSARKVERGQAGPDGVWSWAFTPESRGAWRLNARATGADGALLGEASTAFAVTARDPELEEIDPDRAFLEALATRVGGRYVGPGERTEPLRDAASGRLVRDRKETPLYAMPIIPLWFGLLTSLSWWLRRREGLR